MCGSADPNISAVKVEHLKNQSDPAQTGRSQQKPVRRSENKRCQHDRRNVSPTHKKRVQCPAEEQFFKKRHNQYCGETDEQFEELYEFLKDVRLDRVGVFAYSEEEGTPAAKFEAQVDMEIREMRRDKLMEMQQTISLDKNNTVIMPNIPKPKT